MPWDAGLNDSCSGMQIVNGKIYIVGRFRKAGCDIDSSLEISGGVDRWGAVCVDADPQSSKPEIYPWNPDIREATSLTRVSSILVRGDYAYMCSEFAHNVRGENRGYCWCVKSNHLLDEDEMLMPFYPKVNNGVLGMEII